MHIHLMKRLPAVLLCAALAAPSRATHAQSADDRIQRKLDSLQKAGAFIGASVGVVFADGRAAAFVSGTSDTARREPLRKDHRLMAGSVGKTFFAAVAWQLAKEGKLPLDAPISRWFGSEKWFDSLPNARAITVRHLMTHSSGLVRYEFNPKFLADLQADPARAFTPVEELRYLFGTKAAFAAGQGWDYSDTNYIVLGMILEQITGTKAYTEIQRRFIGPLALAGTVPSDRQVIPLLAQGYAGQRNEFGPFDATLVDGKFFFNPQFEWAGGGFVSTGVDLARWVKALYTGTVVDTGFVRNEVLRGVPAPMLGNGVSYGLGVIIRATSPFGPNWGHSGFFPGYLAEMRWYPEHGVAIAVLVNQNGPRRGPAGLIADVAAEIMPRR
jgi:D-alanyl-D-alanine carboxypeptidase